MKQYELMTCLAIQDKNITQKAKVEFGKIRPSTFILDGTEEEIFNKVNFQLCTLFGFIYTQNGSTGNIKTEIEKVMKRNKVKYPSKLKKKE